VVKDAAARRIDRKRSLVDAAVEVFRVRGVADATVDDIVTEAGAAKGTFYLYFRAKDDVVNAVAERMVEQVADRVASALAESDSAPKDMIRSLGAAIRDAGDEPHELELIELIHRPANRAVHDRISERVMARLAPLVATVIADGIEQRAFMPQDASRAAAFVLACYGALHDIVTGPDQLPEATAELEAFVLRGLGVQEP
jgi:AcrR family transcriptional regulator